MKITSNKFTEINYISYEKLFATTSGDETL